MLNDIRKKLRLIEITEDALDRRKWALKDLVRPIFAAAWGGDRAPSIEQVHVYKDKVSIGYQWRYDDYVEHFKVPSEIFEADDPVQAATEWRERSKAEKKAKDKAALKRELLDRLSRLEEEDDEMD
jgi:hypothetical protein